MFSKKMIKKLHKMNSQEIQDYIDYSFQNNSSSIFDSRWKFVRKYCWSIPCKESLQSFEKYDKEETIYDVMAGTGYFAKLLEESGLKVKAFDLKPGKQNGYGHKKSYIKIEKEDARDIIKKIDNKMKIILSWPSYDNKIGNDILTLLKKNSLVFYFGEKEGGCTGNDNMFENFDKNFECLEEIIIPKFMGIHDVLKIYRKND